MNKRLGFTLIELLVVVLIIGILSAVALPQYEKAVEKSRAAEALVTANTIVNNVEMNILAHGSAETASYADPENWDVALSGGEWKDSGCCGKMFVTKHFFYLPGDDATGVSAYRCKGNCTGSIDDEAVYELWSCYPSVDGEACSLCKASSDEGKKICKVLESLGIENRS